MKCIIIVSTFLFFFLVSPLKGSNKNIHNFWNRINIFTNQQHEIKELEKKSNDLIDQREFDKALDYARQGLALAEKTNSQENRISFYNTLGKIYYLKNQWDKGLDYYNKSLEIAKQCNNKIHIAQAYDNIAFLKYNQGLLDEALSYCNKALEINTGINNKKGLALTCNNFAHVYNQLAEYKKAFQYIVRSIELNNGTENERLQNNSYVFLGQIYINLGIYDSSFYYLNRVLEVQDQKVEKSDIAMAYSLLGYIYLYYGDYSKASEYQFKALEINKEINYKRGIAVGYGLLADIFESKSDYENAVKYYDKCLEVAREIGGNYGIVLSYNHIGYNYYKLEKYEKAKQYLTEGLLLAEKFNIPVEIAHANSLLGLLYFDQKEYKKALSFHLKSLEICKKFGIHPGLSETYYFLGSYYQNRGNYEKAISYLNNALEIDEKLKDLGITAKILLSLSENYAHLSMYKPAYDYFKKYKALNDSIKSESHTKRITQMEMQFEFDQKQKEEQYIQQQKEKELHVKIKNQKLLTFTATGSAFLLLILSFLGFRNHKLKQKNIKKDIELQRVEAEKKHEVDQMKLHFFANASHDIRTPLTLIKGPLNELMESNEVTPDMKKNLELINRNTNILQRFTNQILDFQKIDSNVMGLSLAKIDIILFTKEIIQSFSYYTENKNCKLDFLPENSELIMWFDTEKAEKILCNLLTNAIKFSPENSTIKVNITSDPNWVYISVRDSGIGIPPDHLDLIFERYHQVEKTKAFFKGGSGIGLAHTKELVKVHKGKINVKSSETGGSEFIVMLPGNKEAYDGTDADFLTERYDDVTGFSDINIPVKDTVTDELREERNVKNTTSVLVVEDDHDMQQYIVDCMPPGFNIYRAYNGAEGFDIALKYNPDVIVSDIMMKNMDGIELCNKIKTDIQVCHIPVILLTALDTTENKINGFETGADDYIIKPFDKKLLQVRLWNIVHTRRKLREVFSRSFVLEPRKITINSLDEEFLGRTLNVIEENMSNNGFSVDILCSEMNMSRSVFYRKIKALTDLSSNDFIKSIRLKYAARLLKENNLTITQIAYETGFTSLKYFSKCFRGYYSKSPSEYAKDEVIS